MPARRALCRSLSESEHRAALWPWIVGGAVLAAGAAVGGYFLLKPSDTVTPVTPGSFAGATFSSWETVMAWKRHAAALVAAALGLAALSSCSGKGDPGGRPGGHRHDVGAASALRLRLHGSRRRTGVVARRQVGHPDRRLAAGPEEGRDPAADDGLRSGGIEPRSGSSHLRHGQQERERARGARCAASGAHQPGGGASDRPVRALRWKK